MRASSPLYRGNIRTNIHQEASIGVKARRGEEREGMGAGEGRGEARVMEGGHVTGVKERSGGRGRDRGKGRGERGIKEVAKEGDSGEGKEE